jgi:hypothetical protein
MANTRQRGLYWQIAAVAVSTLLGAAPFSHAQETSEPTISGATAAAKPPQGLVLPSDPKRITFDFGDAKGWLQENGQWHIEGWVQHSGLVCATYEFGIQFGIGSPACSSVQWLDTAQYATSQKQCNSARLFHDGMEFNTAAADRFTEISCAQRLVRCTGRCAAPRGGTGAATAP